MKGKLIWTAKATNALVKNVMSGTVDNVELAEMLVDVTAHQVYKKRKHLGLTENNKPMYDTDHQAKRTNKRWTPEDDTLLKIMVEEKKTDKEIAAYLGRTICAINNRKGRLDLENIVESMETLFQQETKEEPKQVETKVEEPKVQEAGARYVQYLKPSTEVSILWGLVKFSKG